MLYIRYGDIDTKDIQRVETYEKPKPRVHIPLMASVRQNGFKNPIIVWATKGDIRIHYGTSRVHVARELGILIPAVICDYDNRFPDYPRLRTIEEIADKWTNPDVIRPYLHFGPTKLWMNTHPRVPINDKGDCF